MSKKEQSEVLEIISSGADSAYGILHDADPKLISRFNRVDASIVKLLSDVKVHFPDAIYYTASGGFNLMLGEPHNADGDNQSELIACGGKASISDGDF
ncbi:MAG: hypothetical protein JKY89_10875 [Immundisolibacteraceae bacterium]|nr:hypothetical protein [Immundisolibacteraceae bacterium]